MRNARKLALAVTGLCLFVLVLVATAAGVMLISEGDKWVQTAAEQLPVPPPKID